MTNMHRRLFRQLLTIVISTCAIIVIYSYYPRSLEPSPIAILDNFPNASTHFSTNQWITQEHHVQENTPLLIGFTQNWPMLQQCVVSYIAAGWPPSDIYVVDNTGTILSNRRKRLSITNPSYLNYDRLENILRVNIIIAPSRLSFSQLQTLFLFEATSRNWTHYFWSHADVVALSTTQSLYIEAVTDLRRGLQEATNWAMRFYAYDRLALVSTSAIEAVGGWDNYIPYYPSDCDMYERLGMAGYRSPSPFIGHIYDVATSVPDLSVFFDDISEDTHAYATLNRTLSAMMKEKNAYNRERNTWQEWQTGGAGEPYHYNHRGAHNAHAEYIALGRKIYKMKWGTKECRLQSHGKKIFDMWGLHRWFA